MTSESKGFLQIDFYARLFKSQRDCLRALQRGTKSAQEMQFVSAFIIFSSTIIIFIYVFSDALAESVLKYELLSFLIVLVDF